MGASESKLAFKEDIFRLAGEDNIPLDSPWWTQVCTPPTQFVQPCARAPSQIIQAQARVFLCCAMAHCMPLLTAASVPPAPRICRRRASAVVPNRPPKPHSQHSRRQTSTKHPDPAEEERRDAGLSHRQPPARSPDQAHLPRPKHANRPRSPKRHPHPDPPVAIHLRSRAPRSLGRAVLLAPAESHMLLRLALQQPQIL